MENVPTSGQDEVTSTPTKRARKKTPKSSKAPSVVTAVKSELSQKTSNDVKLDGVRSSAIIPSSFFLFTYNNKNVFSIISNFKSVIKTVFLVLFVKFSFLSLMF